MSYPQFVRALTILPLLLCAVAYVPLARAGIEVKSFFAQKFNLGPPFSVGFTFATDFEGPELNEPGALYNWRTRAGTWAPGDVDNGLYLNPRLRGTPFDLAGRTSLAQIIELETSISGSDAINDAPNSLFDVAGTYQIKPYGDDGSIAGIALSNLLHQPTSPDQRAFGIGVARFGGQHYVLSKDFLTGEVIEQQLLDFTYPTIELFMSREHPNSPLVRFGARYRAEDGSVVFPQLSLGFHHAFSDVVLRPAIFAAAPIPEPQTWLMLLAALFVLAIKIGRGHRMA